ncbi:oxysterol-binding protein [Niveomyces insectorum RCEF 264]|uniref:Oxysterol-binding protein n=1 Tax=Niveomyces insectorum RCEF 264 TaxID=1081102 RepID=A0A167SQW5_9HYPO|nr:oxysterol-binding protein [Niveomyces insectorum RCEF 264]
MAEVAEQPEETHSDTSKLRTFLGILKKFIGVSDLATVRFSLPSQLLEPTPNLEYWNYLDAPNTFVAIGTSDEPLGRMLEVLRFWFTKDLKYAKGRPCKPYNSCLGEFFRCNWDAEDNAPLIDPIALPGGSESGGSSTRGSSGDSNSGRSSTKGATAANNDVANGASSASSVKSARSVGSTKSGSKNGAKAAAGSSTKGTSGTSTPASSSAAKPSTTPVNLSVPQTGSNPANPTVRVTYLTEQTSHHPPVSAFFISCPERGLHARGFDQITAKFTGTSIKVIPGEHNLGIFITVERRGDDDGDKDDKNEGKGQSETYQLTHPAAHLGGLLRGALSISVGDVAYVTCPETGLKAILQYYDAGGWLGRSTNLVDGVIFRYDPANPDAAPNRIQDVPAADVLARLHGAWKEKIVFTLGGKPLALHPAEHQTTLIDLGPLSVAPKTLPPDDAQRANESLQLWGPVTRAIHAKQFARATALKQQLEERQRESARARARTGAAWQPVFFAQVTGNGGKPVLTDKGRQVLERAQRGDWSLDGILEGASSLDEALPTGAAVEGADADAGDDAAETSAGAPS